MFAFIRHNRRTKLVVELTPSFPFQRIGSSGLDDGRTVDLSVYNVDSERCSKKCYYVLKEEWKRTLGFKNI